MRKMLGTLAEPLEEIKVAFERVNAFPVPVHLVGRALIKAQDKAKGDAYELALTKSITNASPELQHVMNLLTDVYRLAKAFAELPALAPFDRVERVQ
jgi:hypothetical protein